MYKFQILLIILCFVIVVDGFYTAKKINNNTQINDLLTYTLSLVADSDDENAEEEEEKRKAKKTTITWIAVFGVVAVLFVVATSLCIFFAIKHFRSRAVSPTTPKKSKKKKTKTSTNSAVPPVEPLPQPSPSEPAQAQIVVIPTKLAHPVEPSTNPTSTDKEAPKKASKQPIKAKPKPEKQQHQVIKIVAHVASIRDYEKSQSYDIFLFVEDAPRNLNRHGMLRFKGVMPCEVGSRLHPFLQLVFSEYNTSPPRHVAPFEIEFFLLHTKDAMKMADGLLKTARQELCHHGAVYEHKQWKSFNDKTKQYIRRVTTPGFFAWYAFAGEHGNEIRFSKNPAEVEAVLNKMSIPALLVVFFRLELDESIRRSAYRRIRRRLPQIGHLYPQMQLRGMAYPICLVPELEKRDHRVFADIDNNTTGNESTQKTQECNDGDFDKAMEHALPIDETQVSHSDGRKMVVTESAETEVGTKTTTNTTIVTIDT